MHPRVKLFVRERDRARARGDLSVVRAITADLRRLGIADDVTLARPTATKAGEPVRKTRRAARARCEHNAIPEHCPECNDEMVAA